MCVCFWKKVMNTNNGEQVSGEGIRHPDVTYERRDLSPRAIIGFLISLAIAGVIVQVVVWGAYKYLSKGYWQPYPTTNPITTNIQQREELNARFPDPRLQPDPAADLNKFHVREDEILNTYGWVDQKAGKVHIPIERAIDIVAASGLPVRQPAARQSRSGQGGNEPTGKH